MDWSDDVAYSVHDVEDAIASGWLDPRRLRDRADVEAVLAVAGEVYEPDLTADELGDALDRVLATGTVPETFDGSRGSLAALKDMTSRLIGRFVVVGRGRHPGAARPRPADPPPRRPRRAAHRPRRVHRAQGGRRALRHVCRRARRAARPPARRRRRARRRPTRPTPTGWTRTCAPTGTPPTGMPPRCACSSTRSPRSPTSGRCPCTAGGAAPARPRLAAYLRRVSGGSDQGRGHHGGQGAHVHRGRRARPRDPPACRGGLAQGAVPLPRREVAELHGAPGGRQLPLLRVRRGRRRHLVRAEGRAPDVHRVRRAARRQARPRAALRGGRRPARGRDVARQALPAHRGAPGGAGVLRRDPAGHLRPGGPARPRLPARAGLRRHGRRALRGGVRPAQR